MSPWVIGLDAKQFVVGSQQVGDVILDHTVRSPSRKALAGQSSSVRLLCFPFRSALVGSDRCASIANGFLVSSKLSKEDTQITVYRGSVAFA